jgi:hypothetical protein
MQAVDNGKAIEKLEDKINHLAAQVEWLVRRLQQ